LLIPLPTEMTVEADGFEFTTETVILYDSSSAGPVARLLAEQLRPATGFSLPVREATSQFSNAIVFRISEGGSSEEEA
jgi:hypothetical protein